MLAIGGLGVSTYLTITHFDSSVPLVCSDKGLINCGLVTSSPQSYVFGIPVAVLGLAFYVFMVAAASPWAWRSKYPAVAWVRLASVVVGIVFVLYLVYTELFTLKAICLWCTSVHVHHVRAVRADRDQRRRRLRLPRPGTVPLASSDGRGPGRPAG